MPSFCAADGGFRVFCRQIVRLPFHPLHSSPVHTFNRKLEAREEMVENETMNHSNQLIVIFLVAVDNSVPAVAPHPIRP